MKNKETQSSISDELIESLNEKTIKLDTNNMENLIKHIVHVREALDETNRLLVEINQRIKKWH